MSRYIDADALYMDVIRRYDYCDDFIEMIEQCPTADVRKNERGEWCEYKNPTEQEIVLRLNRWICNKCFMPQRYTSKFCPNCGADMRKGAKE